VLKSIHEIDAGEMNVKRLSVLVAREGLKVPAMPVNTFMLGAGAREAAQQTPFRRKAAKATQQVTVTRPGKHLHRTPPFLFNHW
jgi:hypothetical protein